MWSLAKKDKENRACQEAHSHAHIIQFDGIAYLFIFWDKMCGLHLTYFKIRNSEGGFIFTCIRSMKIIFFLKGRLW